MYIYTWYSNVQVWENPASSDIAKGGRIRPWCLIGHGQHKGKGWFRIRITAKVGDSVVISVKDVRALEGPLHTRACRSASTDTGESAVTQSTYQCEPTTYVYTPLKYQCNTQTMNMEWNRRL